MTNISEWAFKAYWKRKKKKEKESTEKSKEDLFKEKVKKLLRSRSPLTPRRIKEVLGNRKLYRNYHLFLGAPVEKLKLEKKYRLYTYEQVKNHILNQDPSGKTKGCGCMLCAAKNLAYRKKKMLDSYIAERNKLNDLESGVMGIISTLKEKYGEHLDISKLDFNPFDTHPLFNNLGSVFRRVIIEDDTPKKTKKGDKCTKIKKVVTVDTPSIILNRINKSQFLIEAPIVNLTNEYNKIHSFVNSINRDLFQRKYQIPKG